MKYSKRLLAWMCLLISGTGFAETRPNILLIVSEDNGPELGCYGDPYARTPHLDRLACGRRLLPARICSPGGVQPVASQFSDGTVSPSAWSDRIGDVGLSDVSRRHRKSATQLERRGISDRNYRQAAYQSCVCLSVRFPRDRLGEFRSEHLSDYARHADAFINAGDEPFFLSVNYPDAHDPWLRQVEGLPAEPQTGSM